MSTANAALATAAANTMKQTIGAQVVTKTLDTLNRTAPSKGKGKYSSGGDMAASYDFNKSVLSAVYSPTGAIANMKT
ncbi:hypothetical protein LJC26_01470 [Desulfovibrio sp. OttesenSCG-928-O18]|nr:hypothetical protein [Desulfovibrio sp. OttesenSCG-928-O18]